MSALNRQTSLIATAMTLLLLAAPLSAQAGGMDRAPSQVTATERAMDRYQAGRQAMADDDLSTAAKRFREVISLDATFMEARRDYARILAATGRVSRAEQVLAEGLEIESDNVPTATLLARIARANEDWQIAIDAIEGIRPPEHVDETHLRGHLADLYRRTGQYDQAATIYERLQRIEPDNPAWAFGRALSADRSGDMQTATDAWAAVLAHRSALSKPVVDYAKARHTELADEETES